MRSLISLCLVGLCCLPLDGWAQDGAPREPVTTETAPTTEPVPTTATEPVVPATSGFENAVKKGEDAIEDLARDVDANPQAREISAGILTPIYRLAEVLAFPAFYWIGFGLMVAGVVSFALQLTIGKLVLLMRLHINMAEILGDILGLLISLIGLVLTTQAAAENSTFPQSPAAVLSSTIAGVFLGLIFYWWGQRQELRAARGTPVVNR